MGEFYDQFVFCFIPLFVALDPIGLLPVYIGLTDRLDESSRQRVNWQACLTALLVTVGFMLLGQKVFDLLGITLSDFLIAGGVILFSFSIFDLINTGQRRRSAPDESVGPVPLGVPLMAGPGVFAASLLLLPKYGLGMTALALAAVLLITYALFRVARGVVRVLREGGAKAVSRIASILLAAFAVMMIRKGILELIDSLSHAAR